MTKLSGHFHRDASNRLTYEIFDLESNGYAAMCDHIVEKFHLTPVGDLVVGLDQLFRDYTDGRKVIGLEWDNWSGFIVTAKTSDAETMVRSIAEFLGSR